jgi:hypothetical protein
MLSQGNLPVWSRCSSFSGTSASGKVDFSFRKKPHWNLHSHRKDRERFGRKIVSQQTAVFKGQFEQQGSQSTIPVRIKHSPPHRERTHLIVRLSGHLARVAEPAPEPFWSESASLAEILLLLHDSIALLPASQMRLPYFKMSAPMRFCLFLQLGICQIGIESEPRISQHALVLAARFFLRPDPILSLFQGLVKVTKVKACIILNGLQVLILG